MCLVAFSWKQDSQFPLVISANRDEFFDRPTSALHLWEEGFYAGKDLKSGGTWMGFNPNGRWSLLTNYRDFKNIGNGQISRGKLVQNFLEDTISPKEYLSEVQKDKSLYEGFNLLVSDGEELWYYSNYGRDIQEIEPGIHGLSNGLINAEWPKIDLAKSQIRQVMEKEPLEEDLLQILKSTQTYPLEMLPDTGAPKELEKALSAQLIRSNGNYGTVSATAVLLNKNQELSIKERRFEWDYANFKDTNAQFQTY